MASVYRAVAAAFEENPAWGAPGTWNLKIDGMDLSEWPILAELWPRRRLLKPMIDSLTLTWDGPDGPTTNYCQIIRTPRYAIKYGTFGEVDWIPGALHEHLSVTEQILTHGRAHVITDGPWPKYLAGSLDSLGLTPATACLSYFRKPLYHEFPTQTFDGSMPEWFDGEIISEFTVAPRPKEDSDG